MIILAFQIIVPPLLGKRPTLLGLGPAIVIPAITYFFLRLRSDVQTRNLRDAENKAGLGPVLGRKRSASRLLGAVVGSF